MPPKRHMLRPLVPQRQITIQALTSLMDRRSTHSQGRDTPGSKDFLKGLGYRIVVCFEEEISMLQLRPNCECCGRDLAADSPDACICSFECTFCVACAANTLQNRCPNCGGELASHGRGDRLRNCCSIRRRPSVWCEPMDVLRRSNNSRTGRRSYAEENYHDQRGTDATTGLQPGRRSGRPCFRFWSGAVTIAWFKTATRSCRKHDSRANSAMSAKRFGHT